VRAALREDLILLAMSATLDAARSPPDGRARGHLRRAAPFRSRPAGATARCPPTARWEAAIAADIWQAVEETEGGLLVFLPGEGEIRRVEAALRAACPPAA
jgi:ATP-dependent helicase HrpB